MLASVPRDSKIRFTYSTGSHSFAKRSLIRTIERIGGQPRLKRLYDQYAEAGEPKADFFESAVELLRLNVRYDPSRLARVPDSGPVVFVANHPYGVLDGIVLTWLAKRARPEVKVLANDVLCQAPEASDNLLAVDFSGSRQARRTNIASRHEAMRQLAEGGAIGIFPAGGVGASERPLKGPAVDTAWHPFVAKLVRRSKATVVPVYFAGQNSRMFQLASHVSYTWRLSLFFFETARRIGSDLDVAIGEPIPFDELGELEGRSELTRALRRRTFALAHTLHHPKGRLPRHDSEYVYPRHFKF